MNEKLRFTDEEITNIEDLASCNYTPERIAVFLDMDKKSFMKLWYNKNSIVRMAYDRGKLNAEFKVINKQKELAQEGNITAAQIYLRESKELEAKNILNRILFGDDYED